MNVTLLIKDKFKFNILIDIFNIRIYNFTNFGSISLITFLSPPF